MCQWKSKVLTFQMVISYGSGGANDKSFISRLLGKRRQLFKVFGS